METVGYAALQIIPSFKDLDRNLESGVAGPMRSAGARGGAHFGDSAGRAVMSRFSTYTRRAAMLGIGALTTAAYGAFKIGQASLEEAREARKVGALTEAAIRSTGGAAKVSAQQVADLAEALSNKSGIDDEVIQSGANVLLTFTKIRDEVGKNNDIFSQATTLTADYAAFMAQGKGGIDLKSAAIQVGKALNDPVKGVTALGKAGVQFTESQREQIDALVESGNVMGAQRIILAELETQFGGAAEAQASLADKSAVAWGNIKEGLGETLLPLVNDMQRAFLKKGVPAAEEFVDWFRDDGIPAMKDFYDQAKPVAEELLPAAGDALKSVAGFAKDAAPYVADVAQAFADMPEWMRNVLIGGVVVGGASRKLGLGSLFGKSGVGGLISKASPMPVFVTNPGFGVDGLTGGAAGSSTSKKSSLARTLGRAVPVGLAADASYEGLFGDVYGMGSAPTSRADVVSRALGPLGQKLPDWTQGVLGPGTSGSFGALGEKLMPDVDIATPLRAELDKAAAMFKNADLPSELKTRIALTGGPESMREARALKEQYDLTPREKKTLFSLMGTERAQSQLRGTKSLMDQIRDKTVTVTVHTVRTTNDGVDFASGGVRERVIERPTDLYVDGEKMGRFAGRRANDESQADRDFQRAHNRGYGDG